MTQSLIDSVEKIHMKVSCEFFLPKILELAQEKFENIAYYSHGKKIDIPTELIDIEKRQR